MFLVQSRISLRHFGNIITLYLRLGLSSNRLKGKAEEEIHSKYSGPTSLVFDNLLQDMGIPVQKCYERAAVSLMTTSITESRSAKELKLLQANRVR